VASPGPVDEESCVFADRLPVRVDTLKIGRSFISGHGSRTPSEPILEGIIALAHKLSLDVVAEGIERAGALRRHGWLFRRTMTLPRNSPARSRSRTAGTSLIDRSSRVWENTIFPWLSQRP
jgi:predicted signal transduction protein with EAL and GGDEF domain